MTQITLDQWEAIGRELFGDNKQDWRFQCPSCGNVQSVAIAKSKWPELEGRGWQPWSECIGRYLEGKGGCDWAAYGLFRGPLVIEHPESSKPIAAFDFAQRDYKAKGIEPLHGAGL
jgi:hypothetical protein